MSTRMGLWGRSGKDCRKRRRRRGGKRREREGRREEGGDPVIHEH
jgi:hypothetical protein